LVAEDTTFGGCHTGLRVVLFHQLHKETIYGRRVVGEKEVVPMRRSVLLLAMLVLLSTMALPAMAQSGYYDDDDYGRGYYDDDNGRYDDDYDEPRAPRCDWYFFEETRQWDAWWEYWCFWRGWGWEFVVWEWA